MINVYQVSRHKSPKPVIICSRYSKGKIKIALQVVDDGEHGSTLSEVQECIFSEFLHNYKTKSL